MIFNLIFQQSRMPCQSQNLYKNILIRYVNTKYMDLIYFIFYLFGRKINAPKYYNILKFCSSCRCYWRATEIEYSGTSGRENCSRDCGLLGHISLLGPTNF